MLSCFQISIKSCHSFLDGDLHPMPLMKYSDALFKFHLGTFSPWSSNGSKGLSSQQNL